MVQPVVSRSVLFPSLELVHLSHGRHFSSMKACRTEYPGTSPELLHYLPFNGRVTGVFPPGFGPKDPRCIGPL